MVGKQDEGSGSNTHGSLVHVRLSLGEVLHRLVRVDRDENRADVGEDPVVHEPLLQVLDDGRLGHLRQECHVVHAGPFVIWTLPVVRLKVDYLK